MPISAVDHTISWAMYFDDPESNGLEIYWNTRAKPGGRALRRGENLLLDTATILAALTE